MGLLPEKNDEGPLEVITLKLPTKLKARIDAAAKASGNNRTQTILAFVRFGLDEYDAQQKQKGATKK